MRLFVNEMRMQDVSYNRASGPSHYHAPEGSAASRRDAVFADRWWVRRVMARHVVGPQKMRDNEGHYPIMVTVEMKAGEPGDVEDEEQE